MAFTATAGRAAEDGIDDAKDVVAGLDSIPDLRDDESAVTVQNRDFVIVPIPISDPTLGSGLVLGGAYFHRQTEQQKDVQPASLTGAVGFYTDSDSYAYGIGHKSYWDENKWRFGGGFAKARLRLDFEAALSSGRGSKLDWELEGYIFAGTLSRKFAGKWYVGANIRVIDMDQSFLIEPLFPIVELEEETTAVGLGIHVEYDNRDKPLNTFTGNSFEFDMLLNRESLGGDDDYESYTANYRSYHSLTEDSVLAWEVEGCVKSGPVPLWDTCRVGLRGFNATRYLGKETASAQAEYRWRFYKNWGAVAFAGVGFYHNALSDLFDQDLVPSYGVGLRYMLLESQRVNLRVDYARSDDTDAFYLSVGESF